MSYLFVALGAAVLGALFGVHDCKKRYQIPKGVDHFVRIHDKIYVTDDRIRYSISDTEFIYYLDGNNPTDNAD